MIRVGIVRDSDSLAELLGQFCPGDGPFFIVPNWHCAVEGYGTDGPTLECLLAALPGRKTVVESYDSARTNDPGRFEGLDLAAAREHRNYLREQDRLFMEETCMGKVLEKYAAEYLNVTEEVWAGRFAQAQEVAALVEGRYGAIAHRELYGIVPLRLWEARGSVLVNYAKMKALPSDAGVFFSLSTKNLFGLIPVPNRMCYHGADDLGLSRSIMDMNKIYCALFRVISVCEAMHNALISPRVGSKDKGALVKGLGLVAASDRSVELDAFLVRALGGNPAERHFLQMGAQIFGPWDEESFPALPRQAAQRLKEIMQGP